MPGLDWHCAGKTPFANRGAAKRVLDRQKHIKRQFGCRVTIFRCRTYGSWHLGNAPHVR